jgi:hypothetical protein
MPKVRHLSPEDFMTTMKMGQATPVAEENGLMDMVIKFGPLVVAIIAVALCFYIYNIMTKQNEVFNERMNEQLKVNEVVQNAYNQMTDRFNELGQLLFNSSEEPKGATTEVPTEVPVEVPTEVPMPSPVPNDTFKIDATNDDVSTVSELSVTKKKRGRKPKEITLN